MASSTDLPEVRTLEVCRVKPASNSPTQFTLPLTFFDTFWFKFSPPQRLYFFWLTDPTHYFFNSVLLPSLKHSLSLVLSHFLLLAGSLTWPEHGPKPFVLYTQNDSLPLVVAESTSPTRHFDTTTKFRAASESHPLDGRSIAMFMKAWAHINRNPNNPSLPPELTPSSDRTVVKDPHGTDVEFLNTWLEIERTTSSSGQNLNSRSLKLLPVGPVPPGSVRSEYVFTKEDVQKIRKMALRSDGDKDKPKEDMHLSSFVLVYAYSLFCMVRAKGFGHNEDINFVFAADCRGRTDPSIPDTYFGNCIVPREDVVIVGDIVKGGVGLLARRLSELVKGLGDMGRVVEEAREICLKFKALEPGEKQMIGVAGSPKLRVYELDFGLGRPTKVEVTSIDTSGAFSMGDSKDGSGGIEVGLVLRRHEMELFDALFVAGLRAF